MFIWRCEHKASGLAISLILAAPEFAGLLRLAVPALMARFRRRKLLCIAAYAASGVVLCAVPLVAWPGLLPNQSATIAARWLPLGVFIICSNTRGRSRSGRGSAILCLGGFVVGSVVNVNDGW